MLNGLDLFSGIGGITIALRDWVRPVAYCEIDPYCQGVLLSQIAKGNVPWAPIWGDISTFDPKNLQRDIDIIYGGFPCQDISVAGRGKGLEGERSGLFFEIVRLSKEIKPPFIFLENVPAITGRGGLRVIREIAEMGYDCRWCVISAASIGALHRRERWFLLAHTSSQRRQQESRSTSCNESQNERGAEENNYEPKCVGKDVADSPSLRCNEGSSKGIYPERLSSEHEEFSDSSSKRGKQRSAWWSVEPDVGRVANGVPNRVDRLRALGNAVVPEQAKEAFEILMGYI